MPDGLLIVGDAHCRFDPVFGQGISVAAMEATALMGMLDESKHTKPGFNQRFHTKASRIIATPWKMSSTAVFRHPKVIGNRKWTVPLLQRYSKRVYERSSDNRDTYTRLIKVMNLLQPSTHLLHPKVAKDILLKSHVQIT
ncbi:hypothetical protein [Cytobacillus purgationiresistens]|uniref:2-polyprenyl-6-methoxyphenol hydroxylase-like FAD-dependent oxidoreductase n=1 Tax=Cytobacillus purgationiresistens TaxID=863449 RepID=A0ABU0AG90_9BACI|nr:hypothetical protein [Cytobacillus purgationiresistens]MDQ0270280.1 2-polyprenyl-6-methoxyphenol hydroxylase-like FAD-dependent oxidoreductase [Cytobacillus purgationiresistens]